MDLYLKDFKIISLGYNCRIKMFTIDLKISQETNFFDYIGTPMWAINKLFEDDFSNVLNFNDYDLLTINSDLFVLTNKTYYIRVLHEFNNKSFPINNRLGPNLLISKEQLKKNTMREIYKTFNKFKDSYERRIIRLKSLLTNEKKVLFIRYEEQKKNRIIYNQYKKYYEKSELEYIKDYYHIIRNQYPNLDFQIIYLSISHPTSYLKEFNLIILSFNSYDEPFLDIFNKNKDFLEKINEN